MRVDDLTLEVRDRTLARVGQITPAYMSIEAHGRWCGVGDWKLTLPDDHPMVPHLATPGSGILLLGPGQYGTEVLMSGPMIVPTRQRGQSNPAGTYTFEGVSDEVILQGALAAPDPAVSLSATPSKANDTRTGSTEDILRAYVGANVTATGAHASRIRGLRQYLGLAGASLGRGLPQQKSPRYQNLLELLQEVVAYDPDLGFRVVQVGSALQFQVIATRDQRSTVRFDIENGTVVSEEVARSGPVVTEVIIAGQGEGVAREVLSRTTPEATAAEAEWGLVWEKFKDRRDSSDTDELAQAGNEELTTGRGGVAAKIVPTDDVTMRFGYDWRPGDLTTSVVFGVETVSRVMEWALVADSDAVMIGAGLGDVSGFDAGDQQATKVEALDSRVSNLERASAGEVALERLPEIPWSKMTPDVMPVSALPAIPLASLPEIPWTKMTPDVAPLSAIPDAALVPTGTLLPFAGSAAPTGYLLCQGQAVSRTTYSALFAAIGTTFGAGNGTSTFNLPNMRGRVPVGMDSGQTEFNALGDSGGAKTHTLTAAQLPDHSHPISYNGGNIGFSEAGGQTRYQVGYGVTRAGNGDIVTGTQAGTTGQAHNNLQPFLVLNFIIKT